MEDTLQQEKQELEDKNPNEEQGGIRRRLRDRDLLRKRKAEAEEKETNQAENQRKRSRAEDKGGAKKRGRPRKVEPTPEISAIQEEAAAPQEAPAVVVVPEPAEVIPDLTSGALLTSLAVESKPPSALAGPAALPVFGSVQSPLFPPSLVSPSVPAPLPTKVLDTAPFPVQDLAPAPEAVPVLALSQAPAPAVAPAPPEAPLQVETLCVESQGKEALDPVLIEDLGPDEEGDLSLSQTQDERPYEDLSGTPLMNVPEQNKMFSVPTLSSPPPPQEYLPGNSF